MTPEQWVDLQTQLWHAFHPLVMWWMAFLLAGFVAATVFVFGLIFYSEWINW